MVLLCRPYLVVIPSKVTAVERGLRKRSRWEFFISSQPLSGV